MNTRIVGVLVLTCAAAAHGQVVSGQRNKTLAIRNALVVEGNGTPAAGPKDILIEEGKISRIIALDPVAGGSRRPRVAAEAEIDAAGRYVLPGFINLHGHLMEERAGMPMPIEYELNLWLASGITTVRDVGSNTKRALELREKSRKGEIAAPRLFLYPVLMAQTAEEARKKVREIKDMGCEGIKFFALYKDVMAAMLDEAHKLGLRTAHHTGVGEANAWDDIRYGTTSIEHWYGVPDAAIEEGVQNFPSTYNYNDETDRFRYAGRLWREAKWDKLMQVFDGMVKANVAWDPTLNIYEASRDLQRAQTQPWFAEYLHPALEEFFKPNPAFHGSYFLGWSSTDETYWKENYRIWMAALREFAKRGGVIGMGEDTGFIYQMYGFGLLRGMELHQEAGFHPLKVIEHATANGARILGQESWLGRIRTGYAADLLIVNGNPLENLKVLYPTGVDDVKDGKLVQTGGIEWTVKDGIPYHGPDLMKQVKDIVAKARAERGRK